MTLSFACVDCVWRPPGRHFARCSSFSPSRWAEPQRRQRISRSRMRRHSLGAGYTQLESPRQLGQVLSSCLMKGAKGLNMPRTWCKELRLGARYILHVVYIRIKSCQKRLAICEQKQECLFDPDAASATNSPHKRDLRIDAPTPAWGRTGRWGNASSEVVSSSFTPTSADLKKGRKQITIITIRRRRRI